MNLPKSKKKVTPIHKLILSSFTYIYIIIFLIIYVLIINLVFIISTVLFILLYFVRKEL